MGRGVRKSYWW